MSEYMATIRWQRQTAESFVDSQYSRGHEWLFDGGVTVPASASPHVVPLPYSIEANVDPEEAFVASLSSCHMLFFLSIAAKQKWLVDSYEDRAIGILEKNAEGKLAMTQVILDPIINYSGSNPTRDQEMKMHHLAHQECFIANSVKTVVEIKRTA